MSAYKSNLYIEPAMNISGIYTHVLDLGVSMSSNCTFDFHISNLYTRCSNLACLVKQFAICLGVVVILLLNVMEVFSVGRGALLDRPCMVYQSICVLCM